MKTAFTALTLLILSASRPAAADDCGTGNLFDLYPGDDSLYPYTVYPERYNAAATTIYTFFRSCSLGPEASECSLRIHTYYLDMTTEELTLGD